MFFGEKWENSIYFYINDVPDEEAELLLVGREGVGPVQGGGRLVPDLFLYNMKIRTKKIKVPFLPAAKPTGLRMVRVVVVVVVHVVG